MINVEWCSICTGKPAVGTAVVRDESGDWEIGLCEDCYKKVAPSSEHYSIAW